MEMFPVEVTVVTVDPSIIAEHQKSVYQSFNFSQWMKLLNMYKHNQMWKNVNECIAEMNKRFVIRENFWVKQVEEHWNRLDYDHYNQLMQFWQLMKSGFQNDYQMNDFGEKMADWIIHTYKNMKSFTLHQAEIKMQWLIQKFKWDIANGAKYFQKLRSLYSPLETNKIRVAYQRQLQHPFSSNDVMFDEYRSWQKIDSEIEKTEQSYERMKDVLDQLLYNIDNKIFSKLQSEYSLKIMHEDSQYGQLDFLKIIRSEPSLCKRVQFLRKEAKDGKLQLAYLQQVQRGNILSQSQLIEEYKRYIDRAMVVHSFHKIQIIQKQYLVYLVRRINKHLIKTQPQQYLDEWGDKVTFFRSEIMKFISKAHKGVQMNLYKYWADVQTYVVKDVDTLVTVYQSLLKIKDNRYQTYFAYSDSLVALNNVQKALKVMEKAIQKSDSKQQPRKKLRQMLQIFGQIQSILHNPIQQSDSASQEKQQSKKQNTQKDQIFSNNLTKISGKRERTTDFNETDAKIDELQKQRYHPDAGKTIYISGIPQQWAVADIMNLFDNKEDVSDIRIVDTHKRRKTNQNRKIVNICYVDMVTKESAEAAIKNNRRKDITMEMSQPPRQVSQQKTIFFAGLSNEVTQDDLRIFLKQYQGLQDIRIPIGKEGRSGIAYVQFSTIQNYQNAWNQLLKKKLILKNRVFMMKEWYIIEQYSDSQRQISKNASTVVFLQGLAYKANQNDIINFFKDKKIQNIKEIHIPKDHQGKSRGYAFVEFSIFKDYQNALDLKNGQVLGRHLKIKKSDRKITHQNTPNQQTQKSNSDFLKLFK